MVIAISVVMFCYWFRYTCSLILSTHASEEYAGSVAASNRLEFPLAAMELATAKGETLERIHGSLDRDYRLIGSLLRRGGNGSLHEISPEDLILRADFHGLRLWFMVCRYFSETASRRALEEMSQIVRHFANTFGERVADPSRA
ncbi:MAG: hypothetical protein JJE04_04585 [Acidobacteriia bacterium]|nr:hypothetical protein [Terriglobia bacterium]